MSVAWKLPDGTMQAPIAGAHLLPYTAVLPTARLRTSPTDKAQELAINEGTSKGRSIQGLSKSFPRDKPLLNLL